MILKIKTDQDGWRIISEVVDVDVFPALVYGQLMSGRAQTNQIRYRQKGSTEWDNAFADYEAYLMDDRGNTIERLHL